MAAPRQDPAVQTPVFRADVDIVVVSVVVADARNRHITGLEKSDFQLFEDKVEQRITQFDTDRAPLSVGVVLDSSRSMSLDLEAAKNSILAFLRRGIPDDEYFLLTFDKDVTVAQNYTSVVEDVDAEVKTVRAKGRTALFDAVYFGVEKLSDGRNPERVLLVATDGEDNSSRYARSELEEVLKESGVRVYFFGDWRSGSPSLLFGTYAGYSARSTLRRIASMTGGQAFFPRTVHDLDLACEVIHTELRTLYHLGYAPTNRAKDGSWRALDIRIPSPGLENLKVRVRSGYYAPSGGSR